MRRKLIGIITAAAMLLPCVPQLVITAAAAGEITTISSASDLQALASEVNNGTSYAGKKIKLTTDITLSGTWTPIGNSTNKFEGTFDGQGYSISNLNITTDASGYQGLFGYVYSGIIKNLTVNGRVEVSGTSIGIGGIVGYLDAATVSSCKSTVTVDATGSSAVGGIVGYNATGIITDCYSTGNVSGDYNVGGITGWNNFGTVSNCHRYSGTLTIQTGSSRGHIVGENDGSVTRCYYLSSLTGNGIGGESSYGTNDAASLSADAFRNQYSFTEWDFTNTWTMGTDYPELHYDPYFGFTNHIKTVEQLELLRDAVNSGAAIVNNYQVYYLDNDLDLSGISNWEPIGISGHEFNKTFTGGDKNENEVVRTITGLTINSPGSDDQGLFGRSGGTIKNLTLSGFSIAGKENVGCLVGNNRAGGTIQNITVSGASVSGTGGYVGGIVGHCISNTRIENVAVNNNTTVSGTTRVGGVAGHAVIVKNATIGSCTVTASDSSSYAGGVVGELDTEFGTANANNVIVTGKDKVGGLVGHSSYASLNGTGSSVTGLSVSGQSDVGGIVGETGNCTISNYTSSGTVNGTNNAVGGIAGSTTGSINNCVNNASVTGGYKYTGGIVGYGTSVSNCTNNAVVTGSRNEDTGGIAGYIASVSGCTNNGTVSAAGNNIGGIAGATRSYGTSSISSCVNSASVTGTGSETDSVGGIVGYNGSGTTVTGCHATNTSSVEGHVNVGGIVGKNKGTVKLSYNEGSAGDYGNTNVGGVVGSNDDSGAVLENCYNTGYVTGTVIGGVIGISTGTVQKCYSKGSLGGSARGGVIGNNNGGSVTNCYYLDKYPAEGVASYGMFSDSRALSKKELFDETNFKNWDFNDTSIWTLSSSLEAPVFFDLKLTGIGEQETGYYTDKEGNYYSDATAFVINLDCGSVSTRPFIKGTITSGDNKKEFEGRLGAEITQGEVAIGLIVTGLADAEAELSAMAVIE